LIPEIHRDGLVDVNQEDEQQADLDHRNQRVARERVCVLVERDRTEEDEGVTGDMGYEVKKESEAGNANEQLRAD
jgi:hypothetical protein